MPLLQLLQNELGLFNGTGTTVLVANQGDWAWLDGLRLDSQLYYYKDSTSSIEVFEVYAMMQGPQSHRIVATWNDTEDNLQWLESKVWQERRSNLMGAEIRNGLKFWSLYNYLVMNGTEVVANTGIYADMMDRLAKELNFTQRIIHSRYKHTSLLKHNDKQSDY